MNSYKNFGIIKDNNEIRSQIKVYYYNDENDFAVKLITKNNDEIIVIKNPKGETFDEIYKSVENKKEYEFYDTDNFMMPKIDFNVLREYTELETLKSILGIIKLSVSKNSYSFIFSTIEKAIQSIMFSLDEKGGKVKSEAGMDVKYEASSMVIRRNFYVNDTFALFLKESNKEKPYFAVRVDDISKFQQ